MMTRYGKIEIEKFAGEIIFALTDKWEYLRGKNEDFVEAIIPTMERWIGRVDCEKCGKRLTGYDTMLLGHGSKICVECQDEAIKESFYGK